MDIFGVAVLVFLVTDPFGNIAIYLAALKNVAPERRMRVALRELLLALALLMLFLTFGDKILSGLGLSRESTAIAGGIILFVIAMRLIFPRPEGVLGDLPDGEPLLVPLVTGSRMPRVRTRISTPWSLLHSASVHRTASASPPVAGTGSWAHAAAGVYAASAPSSAVWSIVLFIVVFMARPLIGSVGRLGPSDRH